MAHPLIYTSYGANNEHIFSNENVEKISRLLGEVKATGLLQPVAVFTQGDEVDIALNYDQRIAGKWVLKLESDFKTHSYQGDVENNHIVLPSDLPLGYHDLSLITDNQEFQCRIIITPETAYIPEALQQQQHLWGAFLQLYTLRSEHNWGIGDFGDLCEFLVEIAKQGGAFVGLNPIHALFPANPESASPYSPSSRLWQNIIYIDVAHVEAFQQSNKAQAWFNSKATQDKLVALRRLDYVDYTAVTAIKLEGLRLAYEYFQTQDQTEFEDFITLHNESLRIQATFDALHQWLNEQYPEQWGWNSWNEEYQDYHNPSVKQFQTDHAELVRFYMWLQFVASQQLQACYEIAQFWEMPIGFYRDLAVGVANNGAETWADKSLYVLDASIGAPPDMMAPQGQNWGLSPMHPQILQERAYQPFIDLLRANMQDCGALRIDHILGLMRLWWVANNDIATNGVYVKYPFADLLSIIALESQRNECLVIAEALGTVPEGILPALKEKGIFAYNLFYFENENGKSKPLSHYNYQSMTTLSTHDLPTIRGFWQGYDFKLGKKYNVYPSEEVLNISQQDRIYCKNNIREAVESNGYCLEQDSEQMSLQFAHSLQRYVAKTTSALYGTQPEDWLNMLEPVNIPGTSTEYPNWRRKLAKQTNHIFTDVRILELLDFINTARNQV